MLAAFPVLSAPRVREESATAGLARGAEGPFHGGKGECLTTGTQSNGESGGRGVGGTACVTRSAGAERDFRAWVAARRGPGKARQLRASSVSALWTRHCCYSTSDTWTPREYGGKCF